MRHDDTIRILQLTDTHLFKNDDEEMFGVHPNKQLTKLVNHLISIKCIFDFILLTGDISQDMSTESYQVAVNILSRFQQPIYWIPGNHDDVAVMKKKI